MHILLEINRTRDEIAQAYRTLGAASAQNNSKNKCRKFWNIIGIFAEYIFFFSKLPKSKNFLLLTRILLTV
jgi:hypothetical protein